jgi:hypothetical protein
MSSQQKVNFDTGNSSKCFKALAKVHSKLANQTVQAGDRTKHSVKTLSDMVYYYIPRSTDDIRTSANGGLILGNILRTDWLHDKASWQLIGINAGFLSDIVDQNGYPAPMTMNGIPIDIRISKYETYSGK